MAVQTDQIIKNSVRLHCATADRLYYQWLIECYSHLFSGCQEPLGMESGAISDGQITASSQWDANHAAMQGRLHFKAGGGKQGGWSARRNDANQWLQVDRTNRDIRVTHIATQGRNAYGQWVTKYKLQYSNNGVHFQYYREQGQSAVKVK